MTTLADISLTRFSNVLTASIHLMTLAKEHFTAQNRDIDELVNLQLIDDMLPLSFQINSIQHYTLGATKALLSGDAYIPAPLDDHSFDELLTILKDTFEELNSIDASEVNEHYSEVITFHYPGREMAFSADNFVLSFVLPSLFFHQTTLYNLLRKEGVPLGKKDYLGVFPLVPSSN